MNPNNVSPALHSSISDSKQTMKKKEINKMNSEHGKITKMLHQAATGTVRTMSGSAPPRAPSGEAELE